MVCKLIQWSLRFLYAISFIVIFSPFIRNIYPVIELIFLQDQLGLSLYQNKYIVRMLGIFVILLISWALLQFVEKKNLSELGLLPNKIRASHFLLGFIFLFILNLCTVFMDTIVYSIEWTKNPDFAFLTVLKVFYFHLKSALTEELVFRGAILYILLQRLGLKWGIALSSIAFGVYHWFTYGMFGSIVPMIYVFIITNTMGLIWAYCFAKTGSIYLALGLHLGTNLSSALFSRLPTGSLLWIETSRIDLPEWTNLCYLLAKGLVVPELCFFFILYFSYPCRNTSQKMKHYNWSNEFN